MQQQDHRENVNDSTTVEELAADGMKRDIVKKRIRTVRMKNPLAEEEAIKSDDTHPD